MASSSSMPLLALPVSEKLTKSNYILWQAQVLPAIRGAQLESFLDINAVVPPPELVAQVDGKPVKSPNPAYATWITKNQQVLSYLLTSMTRDVLPHVTSCKTAAQVWMAVETMFSSQTKAREMNTRIALATTQKGNSTMAEFVAKMKALGDEMAAVGKPLDDNELAGHIITGLDSDYNPIVSSVIARTEPITIGELYAQLLAFETCLEWLYGGGSSSSANLASRGGRGRGRGHHQGQGCGNGNDRGRGSSNNNTRPPANNNNNGGSRTGSSSRELCQLCGRGNHTVIDCWYRFDEDFVPPEKSASAAMNSYGVDTNWYTDTGATDCVTGDLNRLSIHEKYNGNEQIRTANGEGQGYEESPASRQV